MPESIRFETPENIQIAYSPAGPGTRFHAWVLDQVLVTVVVIVVFFAAILGLALFDGAGDLIEEYLDFLPIEEENVDPQQLGLVFIGIFYLVYGLGSMVYFGFSELLLRGQTFGKRSARVRVVKSDGFALDTPSIFLRNVFRVVDQMPLLWLVPLFSPKSQRFGDMVAGTLVIEEGEAELPPVRAALAGKSVGDAEFRFDDSTLAKLRPQDAEALEQLLERWGDLEETQRSGLSTTIVSSLVDRLGVDPPPSPRRQRFLEDLLSAEYRRRNRAL